MLRRLTVLPALALVGMLSLPATAQDASTVVATVNGVDITIGHMIIARATLPQQYQQLPDDVLFNGILDQLIQQTVLSQSFDGTLPPRVPLSIENETRSLTAGEVVENIMANAVTDSAVQALYDEKYADQAPGTEYNASHILVASEDEAKAIVEELNGGAEFTELARTKSTGPSGPNGGSLGWFSEGMMVPPFEQAVLALEVGGLSEPVQTQFGWHVIVLNDTRPKDVPSLENVREELEGEIRQRAVEDQVDALVSKAIVDRNQTVFDPTILRDLELVE